MEHMESFVSKLKKVGLSEKAAILYAHLLELGGAYPSHLSELAKINRSTTYKILLDLSVKGLVNEIQKGKKLYYQIAKPSQLLRYTASQVNRANTMDERAQNIFPEIEQLYSNLPQKPKVVYFEGAEEVMRVYDDHTALHKPYEMVCFASSTEIYNFLPNDYFKKYRQAKEKIGITTRGILSDNPLDKVWGEKLYGDVSEKFKPIAKYIPSKQFPFQGEITAYGDNKVSIINLNNKHITAVVIEDVSFHKAMRTIFELAWKGVPEK